MMRIFAQVSYRCSFLDAYAMIACWGVRAAA